MQVERYDRLQENMGQPAGQKRRHQECEKDDQHNPRRGGRQRAKRTVCRGRNAQHRSVSQTQRIVIGLFRKRCRQSAGFAYAVFQCICDFRTGCMVLHLFRITLIVIEDRPIRIDQCDAVCIHLSNAPQLFPVIILHNRSNIVAFICQTAPHIMRQPGMNRNQQQGCSQQQRDQCGQKNTAEYAFSHPWSPMR